MYTHIHTHSYLASSCYAALFLGRILKSPPGKKLLNTERGVVAKTINQPEDFAERYATWGMEANDGGE